MQRINEKEKQAFDINELQYYKGGSTPLFYDLGHYVALSHKNEPALIDEFTARLDRAFPAGKAACTQRGSIRPTDRATTPSITIRASP